MLVLLEYLNDHVWILEIRNGKLVCDLPHVSGTRDPANGANTSEQLIATGQCTSL